MRDYWLMEGGCFGREGVGGSGDTHGIVYRDAGVYVKIRKLALEMMI